MFFRAILLACLVAYATCAAPINDVCANRTIVASEKLVYVTVDPSEATSCNGTEVCGNCDMKLDTWYEYTAPCTGIVRVDTCDWQRDTKLGVYKNACPASNLTANDALAAAGDDCDDYSEFARYDDDFAYGCGASRLQEMAGVKVVAGDKIIVRVGLVTLTRILGGTLRFQCQSTTNDVCPARLPLPIANLTEQTREIVMTGNDGATSCDPANESCGTCSIINDMWFEWQATCTGLATIDTCFFSKATRLALFRGSCPVAGTNSILGDDVCERDTSSYFCGGGQRQGFFVALGETIIVRVGVSPALRDVAIGGAFGVSCDVNAVQPVNDVCSTAQLLPANGTARVNSTFATTCSDCGDCDVPKDLWYKYVSPCTGTVLINTCDTDGDSNVLVAAHKGKCREEENSKYACGAIESRQCPEFTFSGSISALSARAGDVINVRIGSQSAFTGTLNITCDASPVNDNCDSRTAVASNGTAWVDNEKATTCPDRNCGFCSIQRDVWFSYVADCNGTAIIDTCSIDGDTELSVHRDNSCNFTPRTFNDGGADHCNNYDSLELTSRDVGCGPDEIPSGERATLPVTIGDRVILRVGSHRIGQTVRGLLYVSCVAGAVTLPPTTPKPATTTQPSQCPPCTSRNVNGDCAPECQPVQCSKFVAGWSGKTCMAYAADSTQFCSANGKCPELTDLSLCTDIKTAPLVTCADFECVEPMSCLPGSLALGAATHSALCNVGQEAKCGDGLVCSQIGGCVAATTGAVVVVGGAAMPLISLLAAVAALLFAMLI